MIDGLENLGAKDVFDEETFVQLFNSFDLDGSKTVDKAEMI